MNNNTVKQYCNRPETTNKQQVWQLFRGVKHLIFYLDYF